MTIPIYINVDYPSSTTFPHPHILQLIINSFILLLFVLLILLILNHLIA
nr:MAG TPA: Protein of unknown function (DUF3592) [Crassvirales sp.]